MKTCVLCPRTTSPKNGVTTSADAVLCTFCLSSYENSPECRREQHYLKAKSEGPARAALSDYVMTVLKIRQVEKERLENEKALADKTAADQKAADEKKAEGAKNGVETKPEVRV